eukprot:g10561.t1
MASADPAAADSLLPGNILNSFRPANANAATVGAHGSDVPLSERLRRCSLNIQANWVAGRDATSVVDYNGLEASAEWQEFLGLTAELTFIPPEPDGDPAEPPARQNVMPADVTERKAFLINLYNVLMMHGVLAKKCHARGDHEDGAAAGRHPIREMQENAGAANFFRQTAYEVDGVRLSLDDIEHGLLRGSVNKDWVATKWSPSRLDLGTAGPLFRSWVVPELDGRIHFALNCGAKGCPMIQVYNAKNLERGLEGAARSFLRAETKIVDAPVSSTQLQVEASMLFKWYGGDFGSTDAERILFLQKYLAVEEAEKISSALKEAGSGAELVFRPYDWSLNSAD